MAPFVHGTWNSTVPKLVFSRCSGKPSTATRHPGPKTGTVFSVRENPSKSPKRPALPGAVNWEGAVSRHRPFLLLFFHTPSAALIRAFFHWPDFGPLWAFLGLGRVLLYPGRKLRTQGLTGRRNPVLFRRKRRVLRTRGFLSDQAIGLVLHTGRNRRGLGLCCWAQKSRCLGLPGNGLLIA